MQLSLIYYSVGVTISFCKFWVENEVRYCHLLCIWYVFIVDTLFYFFFLILHIIRYADLYLKIFGYIILVLYTHQI